MPIKFMVNLQKIPEMLEKIPVNLPEIPNSFSYQKFQFSLNFNSEFLKLMKFPKIPEFFPEIPKSFFLPEIPEIPKISEIPLFSEILN